MIFFVLISSIFIAYCLIRLLDVISFVHYLDSNDSNLADSLFIVSTLIWFVINVFLDSGVFIIVVFITLLLFDIHTNAPLKRKIRYAKAILWTVIAANAIIVFNALYLKINTWEQLFKLFK